MTAQDIPAASGSDAAIPAPGPDSAREVLTIKGLTKQFPGTLALDDVSFGVRQGEIHALLGENGAGKSTLIKCICGAYSATGGDVLIEGKPVQITSPADAGAAGIAVVHQHMNLVPTMSVAENLHLGEKLPRRAGLLNWSEVHRRARQVLDRVGVDIPTTALISELRPEQHAMISIARAVSAEARIIILDEPTNALLPHEVERLFDQMRVLTRKGHSFLYVSHRLSEVFQIADRATVLRDGRLSGTFDRSNMTHAGIVGAIVGRDGALAERRVRSHSTDGTLMRVQDLSGRRADGISFDLAAGEIVGIAGLPGSGADETMNLLFGRRRSTRGGIEIDGKPVRLRDPGDAIAAGIAYVPRNRLAEAVFHADSVRANVTLPSLAKYLREPILRLVHRGREDEAAREVTERMRVRMPGIEASIDDLSGGNQQKVVLGRWLSTGANIFLLNSPTAAVDVGAKKEIYDLIDELAREGKGIVFASTELEEYALVCDRVFVFAAGRVAGELRGEDVTEPNIMTLAAGGALAA
ncbi:sugar ABC transporter ATP-binding protein [Antarcticimicrobium luteum]|uniref:Sugar ABC transporter ATP-binding protein n=1 Tax=Antarcticimicrobium luteum TaxID=2547397 RepID=A0A4R5V1R9_9RHOB|nr:sugar ABC transporter ATP-binding protein [Antarcticimicrobium luteum]TDK45713.1 sugar ABC transporter ATP-binding protein [Antarcticimicrobium luteum]